jgi:hypothetical protein
MNKKAFTLIEIMVWILIASMVIIVWFQALNAVMVWKVKLIEETNIEKEAFRFSQKFFEEIKKWWTIDYEEYFNRMVVNSWATSIYSSWHFLRPTWFGNSGSVADWFYYCISWDWTKMWTWCINNFNNLWTSEQWKPQRYWQYSLQFIDYNSNYDEDEYMWSVLLWDEDWDGDIRWDDDDEYLWVGPEVFKAWTWVTELYLISADKRKRTFFRWTVKNDPNAPASQSNCDFSNPKKPSWSWCIWTIEFLKMDWVDWWFNHFKSGSWFWDWIIDTWLINKDFSEMKKKISTRVIAWSDWKDYFIPLFPNSINVKDFEVQVFPNADIVQSWKVDNIDLSPYVRIKMTLSPSWKTKKKIKGKVPEFNLSTTINLTDIFSR